MQTMTLQNYTGASLLNARQLNLSMSLMLGEQERPKQLTKQQLMQLLNVLETLAMSSKVLFDGSIQPDDKQQLKDHNHLYRDLLKETSLVATDQWLGCCQQAAAQSALLIKEWLESPERWSEQSPVAQKDAEKFKQALLEGFTQKFTDRRKLAKSTLTDNDFRGAKCVAGLLVTIAEQAPIDQPTVSDFTLAFNQAAQSDDDACHKTGQLASGLIDRFRVNFVNELAAQHSAVYVAAPAIEDLKAQQSALLWRYLGDRLQQESRLTDLQRLSQTESEALQSFPYAYALLMQKKVTSPSKLLDLLFKVRDDAVIAQQAREEQSGKRFVHEWSLEEFQDMHAGLFGDIFAAINNHKTEWHDNLLNIGRSCLPALLSVGSAGLGIVIPESAVEGTVAVSMASASVALENANRLGGNKVSDGKSVKLYRDNYMRWNKLLDKAATQHSGGMSLQGRIEGIFGVPVVNSG